MNDLYQILFVYERSIPDIVCTMNQYTKYCLYMNDLYQILRQKKSGVLMESIAKYWDIRW